MEVIVGLGLLGALVIIELLLRAVIGFGNPVLYIKDAEIGYLLKPRQRVRRWGNWVIVNEYSMRNAPVAELKTGLRILLLGDSVLNGSWWTDQDQTISAFLHRELPGAEILNASANSWGPRNLAAYVARFGTFGADVVVVMLNTDDLFATAPTSVPVGCDRYYPDRRPALAIIEAMGRLIPYSPPQAMATVNAEGGDRVAANLQALQYIHTQAPRLVIALTPLWREVINQGHAYEKTARERLQAWSSQIVYVDFLPLFQKHHASRQLYRDHIHLTPQGNRYVSGVIAEAIRQQLNYF